MSGSVKRPNVVELRGDHAVMWLRRRNATPLACLIDIEDIPRVTTLRRSWSSMKANRTYYAYTFIGARKVFLHRFLMKVRSPYRLVDHGDHDGLNNRRYNLRATDRTGNQLNRKFNRLPKSGYNCIHPHGAKWAYRINNEAMAVCDTPQQAAAFRIQYLTERGIPIHA